MILFMVLVSFAILVCMALNFIFSGSETAVISVNRYKLRGLHEQGDPEAGRLISLLSNTQRLLVMTLIGTNIASVLVALFFRLLLEHSLGENDRPVLGMVRWSELISIAVLSPTLIICCEILPKALFRAHAERAVRILRPLYSFCIALFYPLIWVVEKSWRLVLGPLAEARSKVGRRVTRQDLINLINPDERDDIEEALAVKEEIADEGAPEQKKAVDPSAIQPIEEAPVVEENDERQMVENILRLNQTRAEDIMTPLVSLAAVRLGQVDFPGLRRIALETGYSRFPIFRERIVHIIGYLDINRVLREHDGTQKIEDFIERPHYVPETKRVDDLLQEFLELRIKNAIAVDEYGGCSGWISREDIIEEIVGELGDELDDPEQMIRQTAEDTYVLDGLVEIDDLNRELGADFDDDDWETLAGLLLNEMGRIPKVGDEVTIDGWRARILEMDGRRIAKAQLQRAGGQ